MLIPIHFQKGIWAKYVHLQNQILGKMMMKWNLLVIKTQVTYSKAKKTKHNLWISFKNFSYNNNKLKINQVNIKIHQKIMIIKAMIVLMNDILKCIKCHLISILLKVQGLWNQRTKVSNLTVWIMEKIQWEWVGTIFLQQPEEKQKHMGTKM